jgi:alpha-D-xyloside xylohydrolase
VQLDAYGDNSIRVRIAPPGVAEVVEPSLQALIGVPPALSTQVSGDGQSSLTNGNLRITIDPATSYLTAVRISDGATLLKQTALVYAAPDVPTSKANTFSSMVSFAGTAGEKVYGLGEHRTGTVNQMPFTKRFADSQDYGKSHGGDVSIPWYASSLEYGFIWNSAGYGSVEISESAITWRANATQGIDMWVSTTGVDFDPASGVSPYAPLLAQYVDAVGHASTMPYYATGFIQCKDRYRNQSQLLDVARGYIDRQLPISVIVIDWMHWTAQSVHFVALVVFFCNKL